MTSFYDNVFTDKPDVYVLDAFIHVQDAAAAHVAALKKEAAGGERIIISEGALYIFCKPLL
jgi:nucleoside-diphosphate-sugar epimerase